MRRFFTRQKAPGSVESHVIPAEAGIQFFLDVDPRFRGGDVLTFTSMGAPLAHDHSESQAFGKSAHDPFRRHGELQ